MDLYDKRMEVQIRVQDKFAGEVTEACRVSTKEGNVILYQEKPSKVDKQKLMSSFSKEGE